eukprot:GCRY01007231.1.p1 GENE.GCRY01007231.1~~GCRY01007231.1.p1  ORF type:complete len:240 (+),score=28.96 GCRY01007231.1:121-840(+)
MLSFHSGGKRIHQSSHLEFEFWHQNSVKYKENYRSIVGDDARSMIKAKIQRSPFLAGRALEVGCGTGSFTFDLAEMDKHSEVVALDISQYMVNYVKLRFRELKASPSRALMSFVQGDCKDLPFNNGSFDCVYLFDVLFCIQDPVLAIKEAKRVLKRGGKLVLSSLTNEGLDFWKSLLLSLRFLYVWGLDFVVKQLNISSSLPTSLLKAILKAEGFSILALELFSLPNEFNNQYIVAEKL